MATVHASPNHSPGDAAPPEGPPWDVPLAEAPLAFLDLEMTGLRLGEDRVVEVCIERVRGDVLEARVATFVDPGERRGNEHVHGIGDAALAGAPAFAAIADEVCAALDGAIVVAHGAAWDLAFLGDELGRLGLADRAPNHAIDTLVLCRRAFHLPSYALQKVAASIGFVAERAHRADDDVRTLRAVFSRAIA
ncbi:MAG: 3'-5' exonuclease, partial [Polyangiales bacterium]